MANGRSTLLGDWWRPYPTPKPLFDADYITYGNGTLSDYYFQASLAENYLLGDYYSISIPCTATGLSGTGATAVINYLNANPGTSATGKEFEDFDLVTGIDKGMSKGPGSDDKIDVMFIIWKNNSYSSGINCSAGYGIDGPYNYSITDNSGTYAVPIISSWGGCNWDGTFYTFTAEYMHGLLGGNNWHTGGGKGPWSFLTAPKGFCTSAQYDNQSNMFCAWDRNHLGWKGSNQNYIGARNSDYLDVPSDLVQPSSSGPFESIFILRDFGFAGDAIRIKMPYIDWATDGDVKNQYLWIENHQMVSNFDHFHWEDLDDATPMTEGLMTYMQVGKDRIFGTSPSDDIFVDGYPTSDYSDPNCFGSWIFPITAEGNYDFHYDELSIDFWCGYGNGNTCYVKNPGRIPIEKSELAANPLSGCSDVYNFYDYNVNFTDCTEFHDGKISSPSDNCDVYRAEIVDDNFVCSIQGFGDSEDTWNLAGKSKFNISSNPAPVPVLTLKSNEFYNSLNPPTAYNYTFASYENRIIHLNGLSIEILEEIPNTVLPLNMNGMEPNDVKVKIKWDDVNITEDVRWCAPDIYLHPTIHTINGNLDEPSEYALNITAGNSISLDRGASPTQHIAFEGSASTEWKFTEPTVMTCLPNSYFHLDSGSDLIIKNGSTLIMQDDSKLEVHEYAHVYVEDGGTLIIEDGAMLYIWHHGLVHVKPGGTLIVRNSTADKGIWLDYPQYNINTAELRVEGTLSFEDDADFLYQGTGFYHFVGTPTLNLSTGSDVVWVGGDTGDKMVELNEDVVLNIDGHPMTIKTGTIVYHDNARLEIENTSLDVDEVNFDGTSATPVGNIGIYGNEIITKCDIKNFNFYDLAIAIELRHVDLPLQVNIEDGKFENCTIGISGYQVDKMIVKDCVIEDPTVGNSRGVSFLNCKNMKLKNTHILDYDIGAYLTSVKGFYLDFGSDIFNASKGIYSTDSKVWMRNGSTIDQSQSVAAEMYGSWNSTTGNYSSLLTMGDEGCAGIIRSAGEGVKGTNTILNIDPVTHDQNNPDDNNGLYDHLWFVRNTGNTAKLFDMCYQQVSSPVTIIRARRNLWCLAGAATNPAPAASNYTFYNDDHCNPPGNPLILFDRTPLSECIPATYDCTTCDETLKMGEGEEEDPSVSVAEIVTDAFSDAYDDFIVTDDDETREAFTDLSVLSTNYDALTGEWTITTIAGVVLPTPDSIIHLITVAKILQEEPDSGIEKITTEAKDIFANYYWELLNGSTVKIPMFTVYPNPAEDKVIVEMKDFADIVRISLVDLFGRQLHSEIIDGKLSIDVSNMPGGLYLVKGERNDGSVSEVHTIVIQ